VAFIRELAGTRGAQFELNALVLAVVVAEDRPEYCRLYGRESGRPDQR
jgi:hypothetical protein